WAFEDPGPELPLVDALQVEDLSAAVVQVDDVDALTADRDPGRRVELAITGPQLAPLLQECAVRSKDLHAVVAVFGDVEAPVRADRGVDRELELPLAAALAAQRADEDAVLVVLEQAVVVGVRHPEVAGGIHGRAHRILEPAERAEGLAPLARELIFGVGRLGHRG